MGNISALGVVLLTFLVPMASPIIRERRTLLYWVWLTLVFRHALAFINAFITPLSSSWGDLYRFHDIGAGLIQAEYQPYGLLLRVLYRVLGTSFWLGEVTSVLIYSISLLIFVELARQLGVQKRLTSAVILYGFMPSPAIHCSVTLREPYQALGLLGVIQALFSLREGHLQMRNWLQLLGSLFLLVMMHQGLVLAAVAIAALGIPWALQSRSSVSTTAAVCFLLALPMLLPLAWQSLQEESASVKAINEGRFLEYASSYRDNVEKARSDYGIKIDSGDVLSFVATSVAVVIMYFVAPLPWQVSSVIDYYAFFEVVVRLALIAFTFKHMAQSQGEQRQRLLFVFVMAILVESMWAAGTTNWGTSLRHHVVAWSLLVLTGCPDWTGLVSDPEYLSLMQRRQKRKQA